MDSESWLKDVHCASSSLCQSVKAVLAAVCYGMAFSDVINALGNIQVCIMDIVYDIGLNNKVTGFKRHDNKNFNSFRSDSQQDTTQENWFSSSYKRKQTRVSTIQILLCNHRILDLSYKICCSYIHLLFMLPWCIQREHIRNLFTCNGK